MGIPPTQVSKVQLIKKGLLKDREGRTKKKGSCSNNGTYGTGVGGAGMKETLGSAGKCWVQHLLSNSRRKAPPGGENEKK